MALGMAFWCGYEGSIPEDDVVAVVRRLHDGGIRRFYLMSSLGMEDPAHVNRLFARLGGLFPQAAFRFSHSTSRAAWRPPTCSRRSMPGCNGWRCHLRDRRRDRDADNLAPLAISRPRIWWRC